MLGESYPPQPLAPSLAVPHRRVVSQGPFQHHPSREPISVPIHQVWALSMGKPPVRAHCSSHKLTGSPCPERADRWGRGPGATWHPRGARKNQSGDTRGQSPGRSQASVLPGGTSDSQRWTGGISSRRRNQTRKQGRSKHPGGRLYSEGVSPGSDRVTQTLLLPHNDADV